MLCCSERSSQRRWEFLQTLKFWVCQCAFMQWGKKRWGTMPYNFQQHYFFLSELTVKNFHLLKFLSCLFSWTTTAATHLLPRWGSVLRPQEEKVDCERSSISFLPFCLPPFLSFPLPFSLPPSPPFPPSLPPSLFNCYCCVNIFSSGFRLHVDLLHDIPLHLRAISRWLLAQFQILFLHQVRQSWATGYKISDS